MIAHRYWNENKTYCIAPLPIDDIWIKEPIEKNIKREGFIYTGAIDYSHKNFKGLVDCYNAICDSIPKPQKPPLHIFTSSPKASEIVDEAETEMHHYPIILHERADDKEILKQLKKSIALLHLSLEEGYGLPIMESLAVGTPVITLSSARIPKEVAEWTIRTDEPDEEAIQLYNEPKTASAEAIRHAKSLNKENYAREIVRIYDVIE
jgi:glycosyltransferase involved in cell wall biosynthesis